MLCMMEKRAGLITNDFISRMDLWPWICAVYVEEGYRGGFLSRVLVGRACQDAAAAGFEKVYLCSDHQGFYEKKASPKLG